MATLYVFLRVGAISIWQGVDEYKIDLIHKLSD